MPAAKRHLPAAQWAHRAEQASLDQSHPDEADAIERYVKLGDPVAQMALVREIVETRRQELTLAFRNLVMVTAGYKSRRDAQGVYQMHAEPCIVFVVRRKWASTRHARNDTHQRLPPHLLTFGHAKGHRVLYGVPTDIQPAAWFRTGVARAASAVHVDDQDPRLAGDGALTCMVSLGGAAVGTNLCLSAMHVLSPVPALDRDIPADGAPLSPVGNSNAVGISTPWGGSLRNNSVSFDAQLCAIQDGAWLQAAFRGLSLSTAQPYIAKRAAFDKLAATRRMMILAPDNHPKHLAAPREPMLAQFSIYGYNELALNYAVRFSLGATTAHIFHRELLVLSVLQGCPMPEDGDSGAAVVTWLADGSFTLVGMFIGSTTSSSRNAFVIPAWQLFDLTNWSYLPPGTTKMTPRFPAQ